LGAEKILGIKRRYSLPKSGPDYPNEDFCAVSQRKGLIGLSDGASISYDSATWARLIAIGFVQDPSVSKDWISRAVKLYEEKHDRSVMSWMAQAAYDRGSFASLLGVKFSGENKAAEIIAIGDSTAVLCDGDNILATYPYSVPEEFDSRPTLISSEHTKNGFLDTDNFPTSNTVYWDFADCKEPMIICVTDALGHWILSERRSDRSPVKVLRSIGSYASFSRFVEMERASGKMRRDDTTMATIQ
jgi:hypothetical protein